MTDYVCTTILEFDNRFEGQVLHRGSREDCKKTSDMLPGMAYSGKDKIIASHIVVIPAKELDLQAGDRWLQRKSEEQEK